MKRLLFLSALFFLIWPPASSLALGEKTHEYKVGFRSIGISNPGEQTPQAGADWLGGEQVGSLAVWYPSARTGRVRYTVRVGEWLFAAERNAKPANGRFPVILLSHGRAGHALAHYDLALALARHGFVVIAPTHYGDNASNSSALFSAALYYHRPRQLLAALHKTAESADLLEVLDTERLGVLGSGSGAVTVLQLAGADLDQAGAALFCRNNPKNQNFCNPWALSRLDKLPAEAAELKKKYGPGAFRPVQAQAAAATPGALKIGAVGLLTPGEIFMLDQKSLAAIEAPLGAVFAAEDELFPLPPSSLAPGEPGEPGQSLPPALAARSALHICAKVDHYSLAAPCPEGLADALPGLCGQSEPGAREDAARERDEFFVAFFRLHLGLPLESGGDAESAE